MSRIVGVSQRVDVIAQYGERRDAIDQKWSRFLLQCDLLPVLMPNCPAAASQLIESVPLHGILLTGGNNLMTYGGDAPERDATEKLLLQYALANQLPLLGVCRGMQFIQDYFGVPLVEVTGHVTSAHRIVHGDHATQVNSYHNWGATSSVPELEIKARAEDGVIEALHHKCDSIAGIMWHPERVEPFSWQDIQFFREWFYNSQWSRAGLSQPMVR